MPQSHRHGDTRKCGATTVVQGQSSVKVAGKLWSVVGDPNTHGNGQLKQEGASALGTVKINNIPVIVHPTTPAQPDNDDHPTGETDTNSAGGNVFAY